METQTKWQWAKEQVDKLATDYMQVLKDRKLRSPSSVYVKKTPRTRIIETILDKIAGYELELTIKEDSEKNVISVNYYLWNGKDNVVYVRDLLEIQEEQKTIGLLN